MLSDSNQRETEIIQKILRQIWVFLAYVAAARLAILLALPPGYASPIWPAAGIAIAAVIVWGPSLTLAIFLGSIATNLRLEELIQHPRDQILLQICLALASSMQAYLGSLIYSSLEKRLPNSISIRRLILEIVLIGPVACITAATLATISLTAFQMIESKDFAINWLWWWLGDAFGAGSLCPLLIRMQKRVRSRFTRSDLMHNLLMPLFASTVLVTMLTLHLRSNDEKIRRSLAHEIEDLQIMMQKDLDQLLLRLHANAELSKYQSPLDIIKNQPNSAMMATPRYFWVPRVTMDQRLNFEKLFSNPYQSLVILDQTPSGTLVPAKTRNNYWPVISDDPTEFDSIPSGFDLGSHPPIAALIKKALASDQIEVSSIVSLANKKPALLLFKKSSDTAPTGEYHQGLFLTVIPMESWLNHIRQTLDKHPFHIRFSQPEDAIHDAFQTWIGDNRSESTLSQIPAFGDFREELRLPGKTFQIYANFSAESFHAEHTYDPLLMIMMCILLSYTINVLAISQQKTQTIATPYSKNQHDELLINYESLRDADRIKANLLANISHQIKTPLQGILGLLDTIKSNPIDAKIRSSIDTVIAHCQSMRSMLEDVFAYASTEIGNLSLDEEEFNAYNFFREFSAIYEVAVEERQNNFKVRINLPPTLHVLGDVRKIHRILSQILGDAIRRTQKGEIIFNVEMDSSKPDRFIQISIESIRNPNEDLQDKDYELGRNRPYQPQEIFNLKLCDKVIQLMGGQLKLEHPRALSTLVLLSVPLPPAPVKDISKLSSGSTPYQNILVVDDNAINLSVAAGLLTKLGYTVDTAANGAEAVERIAGKRYDIIFMDCQMPDMDGFEATQKIRVLSKPERGPLIIALTANALEGMKDQALKAGMDHVITKPISLDSLLKVIGYAPKAEKNSAKPSSVKIMDYKSFSFGLGDDQDLIQLAILRFFEEIDELMRRLKISVQSKDGAAIAKTAHTLKGMTALFAAHSLVEAHKNLEVAAKDNRMDEYSSLLKRVDHLTEVLKIELRALIDEKNPPKKDVA